MQECPDNRATSPTLSRFLSHPEGFYWDALANYTNSVFQIKSLDKELEEHQAYKPKGNKSKHGQLQVCTNPEVVTQCMYKPIT